jgi:glycosyltransferase involved in cell wall biosynthesis
MKNNIVTLSAVVIAKNEEIRIVKCLESLAFADEILVIDNGSTDATKEKAQKQGALVLVKVTSNFSELRNYGKEKAKGTWVLYIDADEIVTQELQKEIIDVIKKYKDSIDSPKAYFLKRKNFYLGTEWKKYDRMQRLFLKSALLEWVGPLHETATVEGQIGELTNPLIHDTHRSLSEMLEKTNQWSDIEAKLRLEANHPPIVGWRLIRVMITGFFRSFIREGGYAMGAVGWIEGLYQSFSMFITYAKLWEMQSRGRGKR